jgi:hypothetical protein
MRDATLVEPFAVQEIFVDGFCDHQVRSGVMTCVGYRVQCPSRQNGSPLKVVVVRLVMPAANINEAIDDVRSAQTSTTAIAVRSRERAKPH